MQRLLALAFVIAACPALVHAEIHYYLVDSIAEKSTNADLRAEAHELEKIYADLERVSGVDAKLVWSTNPDINAFATEVGADKIVIVQEGLLATMRGDRDAVAAVLGHELAHHKADHIRAGKRKRESAHVLGAILGAVVGAKIGHGGGGAAAGAILGNVGGGLVALKFNRDQEMEADRLSVGWMVAAGYNPQGMLRLQHNLGELAGSHRSAAIFSTHPTSEKRYKAAEQQIAKLAAPSDLLAHPVAPLVDDKARIAATAEIWSSVDESIAAALQSDPGDVAADALAPVDKVGFDTYAALQNQLQFAGSKGESHLLAKNHLTPAQLTRINATFSMRMNDNPALNRRYSLEYWRASQGRFAAHGRDLADSYAYRQALKLAPPYPLETATLLHRRLGTLARVAGKPLDLEQQAIADAAQNTLLKPYSLAYYDYVIADNWWMRKAALALLDGDDTVLRKLEGIGTPEEDAAAEDGDDEDADDAAADVHVGDNVQVGKGVRIGGKTVKPTNGGN